MIQPALQVTSVVRAPDNNDAFYIDIAIENTRSSAYKHPSVSLHGPGLANNTQTLTELGGKTTKHFIFADKVGPSPCDYTTNYEIHYGDGAGPDLVKKFSIKATNCTFPTKMHIPWNTIDPAVLQTLTTGSTHVTQAKVKSEGTCAAPMVVEAMVVNHTAKAADVSVVMNPVGNSGLLTVPFHGQKVAFIDAAPQLHRKFFMSMKDNTSPPSNHVVDSGITIDVITTCTYTFAVEGLAQPTALAIPR